MRTLLFVLLALPSLAQAPKAKSVEKENDWDVVTLESGVVGKVLVPKSVQKGTPAGLVMSLHGHGGAPNEMLSYGRALAEHRGDVWCAYKASDSLGPDSFQYNTEKDTKGIPEMTRYVIANYGIDPKRVIVHGYSAGGAMSCAVCPANKDLYAGFVPCAAPDVPGRRGGDAKGLRAVVFLGETDPNFSLAPEARKAVEKYKPNVAFRAITGLGHDLPDIIYLNDAFNFILDATEKGDDRTIPMKPDHDMAPPKGKVAPPPDLYHVYIAWKTAKAPAGVTRNKLQAKSIADNLLAKLKKKEVTLEKAIEQSDDAASKENKGSLGADAMKVFGQKLADKVKALKVEEWAMVETESGYHLLWRPKGDGQ